VKIAVDWEKCTGLGLCEAAAPAVFEIDEEGQLMVLTPQVPADQLEVVEAAVKGCPTQALSLVED
jgi:ferredoxin